MSKPTPGPWRVVESGFDTDTLYIVSSDGTDVAVLDESPKAEDLRLIAAAPDLLSALQACDEAMEYMSEYDIPITLPEQVKAAIKKATGEE